MMKLVIGKNIAHCEYCDKKMTVDDVLEIAECDWRDKHKKYEKLVKYNKGVGY